MNECYAKDCDLCGKTIDLRKESYVDGRTVRGSWADMCLKCFRMYGVGLGLGKGQRYILKELPAEVGWNLVKIEG